MKNGNTLQPSGTKVKCIPLLMQGVLISSTAEVVALIDSTACYLGPQAFCF